MKTRHLRTLVCAWAFCSAVFLCASKADAQTFSPFTGAPTATRTFGIQGLPFQPYTLFFQGPGNATGTIEINATSDPILSVGSTNGIWYFWACPGSYTSGTATSSLGACAEISFTFTWAPDTISGLTTGAQTGFVEPYAPANGSYSTSSPTTFSANYYFNCNTSFGVLDTISFDIIDTNSNTAIYSPSGTIGICGTGSYTANIVLSTGDSYLWRPVLSSSNGSSTPVYGNWYFFQSTSTPAEDINTAVGATIGTSTLPTTTNLLSFLNVPVLLETKFPFAYVFQIANGIKAGIIASSSNSIPSGDFIWKNVQGGTTTIDMFSQATIEYYLSPTLISLWRSFLVVLLYVGVGYALYHRARKDLNLK